MRIIRVSVGGEERKAQSAALIVDRAVKDVFPNWKRKIDLG